MSLVATVRLARGGFHLDVALDVAAGETLAVLGPNGAGKSTLLRAIAGLEPLDEGEVVVGGVQMDGPRGHVPAERRGIGVVFQDHLLLPHLSALDNVAFPLRCQGVRATDARAQARGWLERVGLDGVAALRPRQLSGGQAQRVALARALIADPALLLLDEPLAALDVTVRGEVRRDLRRHLADHRGARLLVTHDPVEAAALADRIAVIEGGRVAQQGTLAEITAHPRSRYVADLAGVNLLHGSAAGTRIRVGRHELTVAEPADGEVAVVIRPRSVALHRSRPDGAARNVWEAGVLAVDREGDRARVAVGSPMPIVAEVTAAGVAELGLVEGGRVWVSVKATEIDVQPR